MDFGRHGWDGMEDDDAEICQGVICGSRHVKDINSWELGIYLLVHKFSDA